MGTLNSWDITDANNNAAPPDGWPENTMQYSEVNNTGRAVQGTLKRFYADVNGSLQAGGVADAYTLTLNESGYTSYFAGMYFACEINATNTGASTIDVNGIGVQSILNRDGSALNAGQLTAGGIYEFRYDGTNFQLMGTLAGATVTVTNLTVTNNITAADALFTNSDAPDLVDTDVALNVGAADPDSAQHIEVGPQDIQSKSDISTAAALNINQLGGAVNVGPQSGTGAVTLYNSAAAVLLTAATGASLRGSVAAATPPTTEAVDTRLDLRDSDGSDDLGQFGFSGSNVLQINNFMHAGTIEISAEDTAGTKNSLLVGDPDDDVKLYDIGVEVARTLPAASGGFEVNNTATGGGFERVLTTSDLGGGGGGMGQWTTLELTDGGTENLATDTDIARLFYYDGTGASPTINFPDGATDGLQGRIVCEPDSSDINLGRVGGGTNVFFRASTNWSSAGTSYVIRGGEVWDFVYFRDSGGFDIVYLTEATAKQNQYLTLSNGTVVELDAANLIDGITYYFQGTSSPDLNFYEQIKEGATLWVAVDSSATAGVTLTKGTGQTAVFFRDSRDPTTSFNSLTIEPGEVAQIQAVSNGSQYMVSRLGVFNSTLYLQAVSSVRNTPIARSSGTISADTDMQVTIPSTGFYEVEFMWTFEEDDVGSGINFQVGFSGTSQDQMLESRFHIDANTSYSSVDAISVGGTPQGYVVNSTSDEGRVFIKGYLEVTAVGDLTLNWSRLNAGAVVMTHGTVKATKLS